MNVVERVKRVSRFLRNDESGIFAENQMLKASLISMKGELNKLKSIPLLVAEVVRVVDGEKAVIRIPSGQRFLVSVSSGVELEQGCSVLVEQKSLSIVERVDDEKNNDVESFVVVSKPNVSWDGIGGLGEQINEIVEVIELPLLRPEIFKKIGIDPPKGILLYGPPGTGKTLLAKAVASSTRSTFIHIVASELVQKYIGDGARLVKDIFSLARKRAPSIVFIDEIDGIGAERVDFGTSGEREVQRTFMQLLTEIDGFNNLDNVKFIAATNRIDVLDRAILRPGRFDRLIETTLPDLAGRREIFRIHSGRMDLSCVDVDAILDKTDGFSGADIRALCTEAGYFAIRGDRNRVETNDFLLSIEKLAGGFEGNDAIGMFG